MSNIVALGSSAPFANPKRVRLHHTVVQSAKVQCVSIAVRWNATGYCGCISLIGRIFSMGCIKMCYTSLLNRALNDTSGTDWEPAILPPIYSIRMLWLKWILQYPDAYFDVILCSHVLEHVPDDRKAMREFWRTLKPNGWAILLVPITAEVTFEDPTIIDPQERLIAFGQEDHVRRYGRDYIDRLREAGFTVTVTTVNEMVPDHETALRMGLTADSGEIYYCTRGG